MRLNCNLRWTYVPALLLCFFSINVFSQVGIGTTDPNVNALLDIDASITPGGLLLPRLALASTNSAAPLAEPIPAGMTVYNIATSGIAPYVVTPGFYYHDGEKWVRIAEAAVDPNEKWELSGNANTNADENFLGTTDNVNLRFRTGNLDRFEITAPANPLAAGQLRAFANGTEEVPVYSWNTPSNSSTGMYIPETRSIGFTTNGRERFRIPNEAQVYAMQNGDSHLPFYSWASNTNMGMYRAGINVLGFSTAGTERMRIGSNGDFGIGTDDPLTRFHVSMNRINAPALASHITVSNSGYGAGEFRNPNTLDGTGLHGTGFIGVYGQSTSIEGWAGYFREDLGVEGGVFSGEGYFLLSDRRIKRNFRAIENGLDLVMKLKPQKYQKLIQIETGVKSIFEKSERHSNKIKPSDEFGLIAQEVEVILPELIATKKMNVKGLGVVDLKSVNYSGFVPILIKAIQQQQAQIIILEGRLNALEMASKG